MNVKMNIKLPELTVNAKVQVEEVKAAPELSGNVLIQRGITNDMSAAIWGAKNGVQKVYWFKKREQVYGVKQLSESGHVRVDVAEVLSWLVVLVLAVLAVITWWPR